MHDHLQRAALSCLSALFFLGTTAGCGNDILLQTSYTLRDSVGGGYGTGTGGGGGGYDDAAPPKWPVKVSVSLFAAENTQEETPIIPISKMDLTPPSGSACTVSMTPNCSLTCAFELQMAGPGPCVAQMSAETEEGKITQCFSYTLAPNSVFSEESDKALELCGF